MKVYIDSMWADPIHVQPRPSLKSPQLLLKEPASQFIRQLVWTAKKCCLTYWQESRSRKSNHMCWDYFNIPEDVLLIWCIFSLEIILTFLAQYVPTNVQNQWFFYNSSVCQKGLKSSFGTWIRFNAQHLLIDWAAKPFSQNHKCSTSWCTVHSVPLYWVKMCKNISVPSLSGNNRALRWTFLADLMRFSSCTCNTNCFVALPSERCKTELLSAIRWKEYATPRGRQ